MKNMRPKKAPLERIEDGDLQGLSALTVLPKMKASPVYEPATTMAAMRPRNSQSR
jgi:hypothetical protein